MAMDLSAWRSQRMLRLIDELKMMHSRLDEMRAKAFKVNDPALKQQLQLDNELWAMMLTHAEEMTAMDSQVPRPQTRGAASAQTYRQPTMPSGATPAPEPSKPPPTPAPR